MTWTPKNIPNPNTLHMTGRLGIGSMGMVYLPTFTTKINQMKVTIPTIPYIRAIYDKPLT